MPPLDFIPNEVPPQSPSVTKRKILLIDTEAFDRHLYAHYLRKQGFSVRTSSFYQAGARCLEGENYDLVIVDQGSPAFEGRVIVEGSVRKDRKIPVLVITRHHNMACYLEAMHLGAVDYLEKPIALDQLVWAIETYLPSGYRLTTKIAG